MTPYELWKRRTLKKLYQFRCWLLGDGRFAVVATVTLLLAAVIPFPWSLIVASLGTALLVRLERDV